MVGSGPFDTFYATDPSGRAVVAKTPSRRGPAGGREDLEALLVREHRVLCYLHRHMAEVSRASVPEPVAFLHGPTTLVMTRVDGNPLSEWTGSPGEAALIFDRLSALVDRVHAAGVVHRDIKPSNVLVTDQLEVGLVDFGTACLRDAPVSMEAPWIEREGGTPGYASPDMERDPGSATGVEVDAFSLDVLRRIFLKTQGL